MSQSYGIKGGTTDKAFGEQSLLEKKKIFGAVL